MLGGVMVAVFLRRKRGGDKGKEHYDGKQSRKPSANVLFICHVIPPYDV